MSDYPKINLFNRNKEEINKELDIIEDYYKDFVGIKRVRVLGENYGVGISFSTLEELRQKNNNNEFRFRTGPEFTEELKLNRRQRREKERKEKKKK